MPLNNKSILAAPDSTVFVEYSFPGPRPPKPDEHGALEWFYGVQQWDGQAYGQKESLYAYAALHDTIQAAGCGKGIQAAIKKVGQGQGSHWEVTVNNQTFDSNAVAHPDHSHEAPASTPPPNGNQQAPPQGPPQNAAAPPPMGGPPQGAPQGPPPANGHQGPPQAAPAQAGNPTRDQVAAAMSWCVCTAYQIWDASGATYDSANVQGSANTLFISLKDLRLLDQPVAAPTAPANNPAPAPTPPPTPQPANGPPPQQAPPVGSYSDEDLPFS
jgi:hypothetical protein